MNKKLALVFPGQGSQSLGMLADIAADHAVIETTFREASEVLGQDLWQLCQTGTTEEINRTDITQPLLLTAGVALWRLWNELEGPQPVCVAGHSLGEYTALVAASAIEFAAAVKLVNLRGKYMQEAVPAGVGSMAAVLGLADEQIVEICEQAAQNQIVSAVNFNSPGQVVIAGHAEAVDRAIKMCKDAGAKRALALAVSVPSHCELMRPAADKLQQALEQIEVNQPNIPVVQNVSATVQQTPQAIKQSLVEQLYRPVLWVDCVNSMVDQGVEQVIECGPGKVLSGLNKRISRQLNVTSIGDLSGLEKSLSA